jgi:hypothetical protein
MYAHINKQIRYFFAILLFCNVCTSQTDCNELPSSSYPTYYYITATVTALLIGKLAYDYLHNNDTTPEETIKCCQSTFNAIQQDIVHYHKLYYNDAQISDWEIKELILDNSKDPYPFLEYYKSLQDALLLLQQHHATVTTHIAEIKRHAKKLQYKNLALQLEKKGKDLEKQISKAVSLVTLLQMRITSFKEYHEDCYYWKEKMGSA